MSNKDLSKKASVFLLLALPLAVLLIFNHKNIVFGFSMILGAIAFPYVTRFSPKPGGIRFAIPAAVFSAGLIFYPQSSFFWFLTLFLLLFILDNWFGRINFLPILLGTIISPVLAKIIDMFSFPIRLKLSDWAGRTLRAVDFNIEVNGNLLILDGNSFSVDPACIGLRMVIVSLVSAVIIFGFFERKYHKSLSPVTYGWLLSVVFGGAVLANFIRLLTLIVFHILPENPLHDAVGMVSLGIYVLLPFYFLVREIFKNHFGQPEEENNMKKEKFGVLPSFQAKTVFIFLLISQLSLAPQFLTPPVDNIALLQQIAPAGFERTITPDGVLKLENEEALIYVKAPVPFFRGSHDPRVCWRGSGYEFSEIKVETLAGKQVYTAVLKKESDEIHAAWWFENATTQTPYESVWRSKSFPGNGGFYMINVNCEEREELENRMAFELGI